MAATLAVVVLCFAGLDLLVSQPGLRAEYFALSDSWRGRAAFTRVEPPRLRAADDLIRYLHSRQVFSAHWRGWLAIERPGTYRFGVEADETAYLRLGEESLIELTGGSDQPSVHREVELERGVVPIEVGLVQTGGEARLEVRWKPPYGQSETLDSAALFSSRPGALRRWTRRALASLSEVERRGLGGGLLVAGLMLARRRLRLAGPRLADLWARSRGLLAGASVRRWLGLALLGMLTVAVYKLLLPASGSPWGGDDVRYIDFAFFNKRAGWMIDRYVHVYLVKAFQLLRGGDVFLAARSYWSFLMAVIVAALAVGVRSLGDGWQLRTLAVTLFVLAGQRVFFTSAGAVWADYTITACITVGVALSLWRLSSASQRRFALDAAAIGALTLVAVRSKPTGAIMLWLVLLFLWEEGRFDLRGARRKLASWTAGLVVAQLAFMVVDAVILGDGLFSLRIVNFGSVGGVHLAAPEVDALPPTLGWIVQVWPRVFEGRLAMLAYTPLGLLVLSALAAAVWTRQRAEMLLLHLMPIVYFVGLVGLQIKGTYGVSPRHVFPVVPTAVLMGGALFHYAGLDRLTWREVSAPRFLVPAIAVGWLVFVLVVPAVNSGPVAEGVAANLSDQLARSVVWPALGMALVAAAPLVFRWRSLRVLLLLGAVLLAMAHEADNTAVLLRTRRAAQRSNLVLYPWTAFERDLVAPRRVAVSYDLVRDRGEMFGPWRTASRVARLYFRSPAVELKVVDSLAPDIEYVLGTVEDLEQWKEQLPGIERTAGFDPLERMVFARPSAAARQSPVPEAP